MSLGVRRRHAPRHEKKQILWITGLHQQAEEFKPDEDNCHASIAAKEGPLPVGARTWQAYDGSKWVERTLTVGLLTA